MAETGGRGKESRFAGQGRDDALFLYASLLVFIAETHLSAAGATEPLQGRFASHPLGLGRNACVWVCMMMRCVPRVRMGVWLWCGSMGVRVPHVRMGILWCGLCGDDASSSQKSISCGVRFFICKGMKNCRITQVFLQVFLGFFYCFFHCFSNLFFRCFPQLSQSVFPLLFLTFFNLFLCVTPVAEMAIEPIRHPSQRDTQAFPCRTSCAAVPSAERVIEG